ncbi:uncharacterized protein CTRU02_203097 [Colletotrichum truncatum]|uniref:Uncharacterized protein n=1 Tax=Colletotrichum truncatum TaxID=5467 RepID=A0ACC3Z896_COLTU
MACNRTNRGLNVLSPSKTRRDGVRGGSRKTIKGHKLSGLTFCSSSSFLITASDHIASFLPSFLQVQVLHIFNKLHHIKQLPCALSYPRPLSSDRPIPSPNNTSNVGNFSHRLVCFRQRSSTHASQVYLLKSSGLNFRPSCLPTTTHTRSPCPSPTTRASNTQATAAHTPCHHRRRTNPSVLEPVPHTATAVTLEPTLWPTPATPAATAATLTAPTQPAASTSTTTCRTASPRPLTQFPWTATLRSRRKHLANSTQSTVSCWSCKRRRKPVSQRPVSASTRVTATLRTCARTSSGRRRKSHHSRARLLASTPRNTTRRALATRRQSTRKKKHHCGFFSSSYGYDDLSSGGWFSSASR